MYTNYKKLIYGSRSIPLYKEDNIICIGIRRIFYIFTFFLSYVIPISTCYSNTIDIIHIPYGSTVPSMYLLQDAFVIFSPGESQHTTASNIELLGNISGLSLTSARVYGYINIGDIDSTFAYFSGNNAYVRDGIMLQGKYAWFESNQGLLVDAGISLLGSIHNTFSIRSTLLQQDISIGAPTSSNVVTLDSVTATYAHIYIEGAHNTIHLLGKNTISPHFTINIWGPSEIIIASPLVSLSFLEFQTQDSQIIRLEKGFTFQDTTALTIPLFQSPSSSLIVQGASIISDIVVPHDTKLTFMWSEGTYFVGNIYTDSIKGSIVGTGISGKYVYVPTLCPLPDNFILGLQDNTIWNGDMIGSNLHVGIINSTINGDIILNGGDVYITNSSLSGNIFAPTSRLGISNVHMLANFIVANDITIFDTIYYNNITQELTTYQFLTDSLHVSENVRTIFSTYNGTPKDILELEITSMYSPSLDTVLFEGDVDFTNLQADILILSSNTSHQQYIVNYITHSTDSYTDTRRIENVLQGFTQRPRLYRNTMSGYDIALVPNDTYPTNYDIVLLGYSRSNDAFSGAYFSESLHTDARYLQLHQQIMHTLSTQLRTPSNAHRGASIWTNTSYTHSEKKQSGYANLTTSLIMGTLGFTSAPLSIGQRVTTVLDTFLQIGYSHTKIHDIKDNYSSSNSLSLHVDAISTWHIAIVPEHAWFISASFGVSGFMTRIYRPYAVTTDQWKHYGFNTGLYTGYTANISRIGIHSYVGLEYRYTSGFSLISGDNTHVSHKKVQSLYPSISFMLDYTIYGFRPYMQTSFIFPQQLTHSGLMIQNIPREYTVDNNHAITTIGLEYTHELKYTRIGFSGEVGMNALLHNSQQITPHVQLSVSFSF